MSEPSLEEAEAVGTALARAQIIIEEQREELIRAIECENALIAKCDRLHGENIRLRSQLMQLAFAAVEAAKQGSKE